MVHFIKERLDKLSIMLVDVEWVKSWSLGRSTSIG